MTSLMFGEEGDHPDRAVLHYPFYGAELLGGELFFDPENSVLIPTEMLCAAHTIIGYSDKQIGRELGISENTVGSYQMDTFHKLNIHNRAALLPALLARGAATVEQRIDPLVWPDVSELQLEAGQLAAQGLSAADMGRVSRKPAGAATMRTRLRDFGQALLPNEADFSHHAVCGLAVTLAGFADYPFSSSTSRL